MLLKQDSTSQTIVCKHKINIFEVPEDYSTDIRGIVLGTHQQNILYLLSLFHNSVQIFNFTNINSTDCVSAFEFCLTVLGKKTKRKEMEYCYVAYRWRGSVRSKGSFGPSGAFPCGNLPRNRSLRLHTLTALLTSVSEDHRKDHLMQRVVKKFY